ncbi:hypothetical protein F4802DRAFT_288202 [Xylaria palmicola]|nr:hypothetical protein F4802DRAFT_288202 [Xylaria palmicola]
MMAFHYAHGAVLAVFQLLQSSKYSLGLVFVLCRYLRMSQPRAAPPAAYMRAPCTHIYFQFASWSHLFLPVVVILRSSVIELCLIPNLYYLGRLPKADTCILDSPALNEMSFFVLLIGALSKRHGIRSVVRVHTVFICMPSFC